MRFVRSFVSVLKTRHADNVKVIGCLMTHILELVCCENNRVKVEEARVFNAVIYSVVFLSIAREYVEIG